MESLPLHQTQEEEDSDGRLPCTPQHNQSVQINTNSRVIYTHTHMPYLDFFILQSSVLSLYRLAASPRFVITNSLSYLVDHLQSLHLPNPGNIDLFPATTNIYRAYSVIINHDTPIETFNHTNLYFDIPPRTVNIFTDGSKIHNTTSAGYIIYSSVHNRSPFAGKVPGGTRCFKPKPQQSSKLYLIIFLRS